MKIRYDSEAIARIARIGRYYRASNPQAAVNIRADIRTTIHRISLNPLSYALIGRDDIRRAVTRQYSYVIYFRIADEGVIAVLSVRHGAERQRFSTDRT